MFKIFYYKNKRIIILVTVLLLVLIVFLLSKLNNKGERSNIDIETETKVEYRGLTFGTSSRDEIIQEIGNPISETTNEGSTIIEYETLNPNFNNQFKLNDNKLDYVREIITLENNIRMKDLINKYGRADLLMYGPGSGIGIFLYANPQKGIAYIGHEKSGYLTEIWYFTPTNIDSFIERYGAGYSTEIEETQ